VVEESKTERIARQIEPDGRQPRELTRTKSFDYSLTNLRGLFALAALGNRVGVDLWRFGADGGRGLRKAAGRLIPYALGEKKWENEQITPLNGSSLVPLLRRAAVAFKEPRYEWLIEKLGKGGNLGATDLLYPASR